MLFVRPKDHIALLATVLAAWLHSIMVFLVASLLIITASFGQDISRPSDSSSESKTRQSQSARAPAVALRSTELLQEQITQQWKKIASVVTGEASPVSLSSLVTDSFECSRLRPQQSKMTRAFADPMLIVQRGIETEKRFEGVDGFQQAIDQLKREDYPQRRVKFKVYRIRVQLPRITTTQFVQVVAQGDGGTHEMNAYWQAEWELRASDEVPRLASIVVSDFEEAETKSRVATLFADRTAAVLGQTESFKKTLIYSLDHWANRTNRMDPSGMQGLAIGDIDGDGWDDAYICQSSQLPNRVFIRKTDGTVEDASARSEADWHEQSHGALLIDIDNDGDQDLVVGTAAGLLLMENDGTGRFALKLRLSSARGAYSLSAADYDLDGDLDLFACVYLPKVLRRQILAAPVPFHDARNGGRNVLLRNDGDWRFRDVTNATGLAKEATRRSFACAWEDYDNDGDPDLYVANDYGRNNLFQNNNGSFVDVAGAAGVEDQSFGMSGSWSDYDRDGWMDLYVANMFSAAGNRIVFQPQFRSDDAKQDRQQLQYMARGNSLFRNRGDGSFADVSDSSHTMMGLWSWGCRFTDLNNDGYEDLVVANGYFTRRNPDDL